LTSYGNKAAAFGIGSFDSTQEFGKTAIEYHGIQKIDGRTHLKRIGTNQFLILQY
tara:strand:- start:628 stop:792 length:165 start_codon:yes stop_codon:yes gene_type:complete